jgi:hypothetical protein
MATIGTVGTVGIVGSHSFFPFKLSFLCLYIVQILCQTVKNFFCVVSPLFARV